MKALLDRLEQKIAVLAESFEDYGVRWVETDKNDRLVKKEKFFKTEKLRDKFAAELEAKDNFVEIDAWTDPQ